MDKNREVRRSFNRPNKKQQHHEQLISGSCYEESRREKKVRRLSSVAADMGSDGAAEDSSTVSPRKFKFPRKIFSDSNTVGPPSVPRKLRSAIRKRGRESASVAWPDSKRVNNLVNGIEPLRKDTLKKAKLSTQNGCLDHSPKPVASVPISKDEEEVAETLFALAGMIPLTDLHTKSKMDHEASEAKALDLAEKPENSPPLSRVPKDEQVSFHPISREIAITTPMSHCSPTNPVQVKSLTGPASLSWPQLSERWSTNLNLKVSVPPANLRGIPPLLRTCDEQPLINSALFHTATEPSALNGSKKFKQETPFVPNSKFLKTGGVDVVNQQATLEERKHNGVASKALHDSGLHGLHLQSSAIIFPSWLDTATSSSRLGTHQDLSVEKLSCSMNGTRTSWKRCAAHVNISRLIRLLQITEEKGTQTLDANQLRPLQTLGGSLRMPDHPSIVRNGNLTERNMFTGTDRKNSHEGAIVLPLTHQHPQEQEEGPSFSGNYGSNKQSFDFLSLSSGVAPAAANVVNRSGDKMESGVTCDIRFPHIAVQHNRPLPFSSPANLFPSVSYHDQVSSVSVGPPHAPPQGILQVPQYFGNPFVPAHMFNMTTSALQAQPKQQQRQQLCTPQLAAQFRPGPLLSSHIANWQNGRKDMQSSSLTETFVPSSQSPLEDLREKYLHISQQPQLLALNQSLGLNRANHQHSQLPSIREDNRKQFHPNGVLPLQLTLQ